MKILILSLLLVTQFCWAEEVDPIELPFAFPVRDVVPEIKYMGKFILLNDTFNKNEEVVYNLKKVINFSTAKEIYVEHATENYYRISVEFQNAATRYIVRLHNETFEVIKSQEVVY